MRFHDVPGAHNFQGTIPVSAAADATVDKCIIVVPYAIRVNAFKLATNAAVTGADTNSANINIQKVTVAGVESEVAHIDLASGTNLAVGRNAVPLNSGTYVDFAEGDMIVAEREKVGTGLALPVLVLEVVAQGN